MRSWDVALCVCVSVYIINVFRWKMHVTGTEVGHSSPHTRDLSSMFDTSSRVFSFFSVLWILECVSRNFLAVRVLNHKCFENRYVC